ncbi:DNA-binding protein YbiB [Acidithiobacillus sp.]|jgi:anthranilate phosphoribosyltransferase|uniref:DNA-binding protein YbiB n=1 Tax=Acidithiobacillus sp. TaxID=1872118 RepID=UPI0025C19AE1|nr:DNA-binding protein YbiB [Acidithiobacillus sp.]MCK9189444.1 DNA-binding protein YbiB [Acidithiobacillus sp.]MCK9358989.1 DNA-binding protein YbiB [Acidithiobacillus sp.]
MNSMPLNLIVGRVARGREHAEDLSPDEAQSLFAAWLAGDLPDLVAGALWAAYRIKGESVDELRGFVSASEASLPSVSIDSAYRPVVFPSYNGTLRGANLLPLLALILARCGVPVLLHGPAASTASNVMALTDHDPSGRVSSAQIFAGFGLPIAHDNAHASKQLQQQGLSYLPMEQLHPGIGRMLQLRQRLGIRSSAHTVVKLINPFQISAVHCAGVTHPPYLKLLQTFFSTTGRIALCLRGTEGEPFANPKRRPDLHTCVAGDYALWMAKDDKPLAQIPALPVDQSVSATCRFMDRVLSGRTPLPAPLADQALCLLSLSGRSVDMDSARALLSQTLSGNTE